MNIEKLDKERVPISKDDLQIIFTSIERLKSHFSQNVSSAIQKEIFYLYQLEGNSISKFLDLLNGVSNSLRNVLNGSDKDVRIATQYLPLLKRAMLHYRKEEASQIEEQKQKSINPDLSKRLNEYLLPYDRIIDSDYLSDVEPIELPKLADFLSIESIDEFINKTEKIIAREYDEKFHILQSPKLFLKDLEYFRKVCEIRNCSIAVAYLDIDDFKTFNTEYTEVEIDRKVLPKFMQTLESFVYNHGYAYRYGGDEYVIVFVNVNRFIAENLLDSLRENISNLEYEGIKEKTTVSIGYYFVTPDCYLTNREIEKLANTAKNFAKENGKDCIATYKDDELTTVYI